MDLKKLTWQKFYYKLNKLNVNYTDESIESMLNHAADDMKKGILKFKPHASTRLVFYKSDKPDTDYLYPIISQLLFIDENDAKSIYDKYIENEGEDGTNKGLTENDLHNVCINVWNFYNEELLFLFRSLKYILTAVENPNYHYSAVCKKFARKQNWKEWYSALQDQLSYVRSITFFDTIVYKPLQKIVHKNLLTFILNQQIEILQLMVLTSLRVNKLTKDDFNIWINNLIDNNFGKNQTLEYDYNNLNTTYAALMCQISSLETLHSLQMICLFWEYDNYIWTSDEEFIESDKKIKMIQHSSEYGAVLMAWAILNLKGQYGIKDLQKLDVYTDIMSLLKLWRSLLNMCQSPVVKDHTITDKLARILCENLIIESIDLDIFDLIDYDPLLIKLLLYLLSKNSELSSETINNLESGIGLFIKKFMGMYPVDLCSLFDLFIGIIKGSPQNLNKVWQLMNNIKTFNAVFPPDGRYIYDQESDTFYLTDKYFVTDVVCNIEIPSNTTFISDGDMVQFDYKVPVFYFLNSAINNFRMCRDGDKKNASYNVTKDMLISSIELIQTISKVATSLNDDLMGTCETLLTLIPSVSYIDSNYIADSMIVSKVLKLARCILVYFPEQTMCYFNANNFFPSLVSGIEDAVVNLHPFAQNSIGLMILKNGPDIYPVLTQYIKFVEAAFKIKHVLTSQCAIAGLMFVFKSIMPLLTMSDFFMGPKEKMDLRWSCLRLIYVISVLDSGNSTLLSPVKKVLDLCLVHSPSSIASLIILNISTIGEKDFIKVMHNYHSWTSGIGKRNIQSLIFALSLLNYIINSKQITEVKKEKNIAMFDPERRLSNLLSYRLTVFHNKLNVLSLTILGTLAEKRFVSFSLSMGFDNDKRARKEMLSYLKLHRLHSVNIVKMLRFLHNAISYQCKMFEIILNVELLEQCIKNKKRIENNDDSILWFIELELETDDFKQEQENHVYLETLGIIHTLWYNRFNLAMNYLEQNISFWKLIFKPLFHNKMIPEINSEIISILSLQAHSCSIENKNEFSEQLDIFLKTRLNSMLKSFLLYFDENKTEEANDIKRKLLYSWKFFTLLVLKNKNNVVSDKYQVVENVLKMFIMELKSEDLSLITSLGECLLIMLQMWKENCVQKNKTSYINIKTILRLVNKNETLIKNQPSKTTVLIVVNEITSIIFSDITLNNDEEEDLLNEIYSEICELTEQHLNCIEENNHDYHSYLINLRLVNALFYKSIPAVIKSSNWHKSYLLTNAIVQMFSHTEKNYRDNNVNSITVEVTDFLLYLSTFKEFHSQFGTQPAIIKQLCTLLSAKSITSDFNGVETKYDDFKRMEVYSNYYKILTNFLVNCDDCVKKEAIKYLTTIYNDLATILNFPNSMKLSTLHLSLVQSVIKLMDLMVSKSYYFHWKSLGGSCFIALEKCIISIWECAYGSYTQLNDPDKLIMSMFKKEKVQLNLTGWKTRGDIFSGQDLKMINETRKILFEMLYCCNAILARIMVPPYEIVSLLQLGKTDAVLFKNIMCDEVILDQKFSTFCTIEELVNIVVFISDKITRHGTISTSLISALNERYVLDVDVKNLNNALELCIYIFTSQLLMKTLQNNDNHKYLNEISDIAKNMSLLLYRTISKDLEERKITLVDIRSQQSIGDGSDDLLIGFMKLLEFIKDIHRSSTTLNHNFRTVYASYY